MNTGLFNAGHGWHLALGGHDVGAVWMWFVVFLVLGVVSMVRLISGGDEDG